MLTTDLVIFSLSLSLSLFFISLLFIYFCILNRSFIYSFPLLSICFLFNSFFSFSSFSLLPPPSLLFFPLFLPLANHLCLRPPPPHPYRSAQPWTWQVSLLLLLVFPRTLALSSLCPLWRSEVVPLLWRSKCIYLFYFILFFCEKTTIDCYLVK